MTYSPAKARLAKYKAERDKYPESSYAKDWRANRPSRRIFGGNWASDGSGAYYIDSFDCLGWRDCGTPHDIMYNYPLGYYTDSYCGETYSGRVLQIPARTCVAQYVPAIEHSDWCGVTVWPLDRHDTLEEAARAADGYAERLAETAREYSDAQQAAMRWSDAGDEMKETRKEARRLVADIRAARRAMAAPESICTALRAQVRALAQQWEALRTERGELDSGFWYRDSAGKSWDIAGFAAAH